MIDKTISLLISENMSGLRQTNLHRQDIHSFVVGGLEGLPWFYRIPIKSYLALIGIFAFYRTESVPVFVKKFPFFSMVNKFVRNLTLLVMYDFKEKNP